MITNNTAIVLDIGSGYCKGGFAGDTGPKSIIPSLFGKPKVSNINGVFDSTYVGTKAQANRSILSITYPIKKGIIIDWDGIEKVWHHMMSVDLKVHEQGDHSVLLTESALNTQENRDKMAEIMFETFDVPSLNITNQALLSMYVNSNNTTSSAQTGVVVDSGSDITLAVPIHQGLVVRESIGVLNFAGKEITDNMAYMLTERGYSFTTYSEYEIVRDMKEKIGYISQDFEEEMNHCAEQPEEKYIDYTVPDGQVLTALGNERFRSSEALFQPSFLGYEYDGLHEIVHKTINKCCNNNNNNNSNGVSSEMYYNNIVLAGGTTFFPGLGKRLHKELSILSPKSNIKLIDPIKYSSWQGGSMLATSNQQNIWLTKDDYKEKGGYN